MCHLFCHSLRIIDASDFGGDDDLELYPNFVSRLTNTILSSCVHQLSSQNNDMLYDFPACWHNLCLMKCMINMTFLNPNPSMFFSD